MSFSWIDASSPSPAFSMAAFDSFTSCASISNPVASARNFRAAVITIRPSPLPRSMRVSPSPRQLLPVGVVPLLRLLERVAAELRLQPLLDDLPARLDRRAFRRPAQLRFDLREWRFDLGEDLRAGGLVLLDEIPFDRRIGR